MACRRFVTYVVAIAAAILMSMPVVRANMAPPLDYRVGIAVERTAEGPRITAIEKGADGEVAGLKIGDLILGIEGRYAKVMSDDEIKAFAEDAHSWPIELIVARGNDVITVRVPR